jgi:hypothetical protein
MKRTRKRVLGAVTILAVGSACALLVVAQDGCILAQPSGELPTIPETRPTILHASTVPSETSVLTRWPQGDTFIVPVELVDPTVRIVYAAFVDYDELRNEGLQGPPLPSDFQAANTVGRTRTLTVPITEPDPGRCHKVEVVVALRLSSQVDARNSHTPAEPGGDIATWFYNPSGDLNGCPALDAGIDAALDAGDASEGGTQ